MPQINVTDEFWADQRVEVLKEKLGRFAAIGACLAAWRLAQRYWNGEHKPIPHEIWKQSQMPDELVEVGLAKSTLEGIYVAGSAERFEWYRKKMEAGKIGGRASASKRQAPLKHSSTGAQPLVKQKQPYSYSYSSPSASSPPSSPPQPPTKRGEVGQLVKPIIEELNKLTGSHFKSSSQQSTKLIEARFRENPEVTMDVMLCVVRVMVKRWGEDPIMRSFLRPSTLFNRMKFENYLSDAKAALEADKAGDELFGSFESEETCKEALNAS